MIRCPGWDATFLPSHLAAVGDTPSVFPLRLGSGPLSEADMASFPLRTGLAITLALGLFSVPPMHVLAPNRGSIRLVAYADQMPWIGPYAGTR